jgi:hypothetical protein
MNHKKAVTAANRAAARAVIQGRAHGGRQGHRHRCGCGHGRGRGLGHGRGRVASGTKEEEESREEFEEVSSSDESSDEDNLSGHSVAARSGEEGHSDDADGDTVADIPPLPAPPVERPRPRP